MKKIYQLALVGQTIVAPQFSTGDYVEVIGGKDLEGGTSFHGLVGTIITVNARKHTYVVHIEDDLVLTAEDKQFFADCTEIGNDLTFHENDLKRAEKEPTHE